MQGLLDDPRTLGLLSLGMRLMSTPGKFGSALGQSGLGAMGDMLGAEQSMRARKRQAEQDAMQKAQFDAQQQRLQQQQEAEQRRNQYLDAVSPQMGPAMPVDPAAGMKAGLGPQELAMLMPQQKQRKTIVVGGTVLDAETMEPLYNAPEKKDSPFDKINPADYTPQSLQAYLKTGDVSMLRKAALWLQAWRPTSLARS
jgi:hypothetical protein